MALRSDESLLVETTVRFREYADAWRRRGIGFMYRAMLAREEQLALTPPPTPKERAAEAKKRQGKLPFDDA